ncbi:MAG: hypothetical protein K2J76_08565, partial [Oscillospiraceae bacterium]|nr:hypothetical protein [Oscillospiraceae bacterium]
MNIITAASIQNIYAPVRNSASGRSKTNTESIFSPSAAAKSDIRSANRTEKEEYTAKQKRKFSDMYVTSSAHKFFSENRSKAVIGFDLLKLRVEIAGRANREGCLPVPIEGGELPVFMDRVQDSLKSGMSLEEIIKQKYDEHISKYGEEGHSNSYADWFAINTSTGEVMSADPISRTYHGDSFDEELSDMEAVMELADDLSSFLRYAVFSKETDDPEKVRELFSFIKNKQADANYDR